MSDLCSSLNIPEHLHRKGRENDFVFLENELLFRRFPNTLPLENWNKGNIKISSILFKLDQDSYNRSKYSKCQDVLYNEKGVYLEKHGVFSIYKNDIEKIENISSENVPDRKFSLIVKHDCLDCNYAHTIVIVKEGEVEMPISKQAPSSVRLLLRDFLIDKVNGICKYPSYESIQNL
jgi:hypothetical protein